MGVLRHPRKPPIPGIVLLTSVVWLQPDFLLRVRINHPKQYSDPLACWFTGVWSQGGHVAVPTSRSVDPLLCPICPLLSPLWGLRPFD